MVELLNHYLEKYEKDINSLAHVGAHLGQEVEYYQLFELDYIYLFEPLEDIFLKLYKSNKKYKNIEFFNFALGSKNFTTDFNISKENEGQSSSVLEPHLHLRDKKEISFETSIKKVSVKRFDSLNLEPTDFINIDAQGYELEVLKGFGEMLNKTKAICCEVNRDFTYKDNALVKEIDSYLDNFSFIRVNTKWGKYNETYGLGVYLKRNLVSETMFFYYLLRNKLHYFKFYFFLRNFTNFKRLKNYVKKLVKA